MQAAVPELGLIPQTSPELTHGRSSCHSLQRSEPATGTHLSSVVPLHARAFSVRQPPPAAGVRLVAGQSHLANPEPTPHSSPVAHGTTVTATKHAPAPLHVTMAFPSEEHFVPMLLHCSGLSLQSHFDEIESISLHASKLPHWTRFSSYGHDD
jgi:hypothetical protein